MFLCKLFKKKAPTIEFISRIKGVTSIYPIKPANVYKPEWLIKDAERYAKLKNLSEKTVSKCPGIRKIFNNGWVAYTWQDISITVNANGSYTWNTPTNEKLFTPSLEETLAWQDPDSFKYAPHLNNGLPILKLSLPWIAKIPKGYNLFVQGMPYADETNYAFSSAIFERAFGIFYVHIQMFFKQTGNFFIPAGTPIIHMQLLEDAKYNMVIRDATEEDLTFLDTQVLIKQHSYVSNYKTFKELIENVRKNNEKH